MRVIFICLLLKFSTVNFSLGYDDISAFKATKQQGRQITDVAENAVDRSLSTCSSTDATTPAWWYVDLGKVKSIYDVEVYFRLYNEIYKQRQRERMHGYKLYISNSTDFSLLQKAYLCFSHTGPELPDLNVTHACVSFGRYVIFYNERDEGVTYPNGVNPIQRYIQLCEVVVQGCDNGTVYGSFCNKTCPTNCQERRCYITNGTCAGCKDGWIGEKCLDACPAGKYGAECKNTCADHCGNNTSCNHVTGYCEGCLSGWMGDDCNEKCSDGTYGIMCNETCRGHCMDNQTCHHVNGHCTQGCQAGYKGEKCDSKCDQGNFGKNCLQNCSLNCVDNCDKINGHCKCNKGWRGENCSEACSSGQFGHNCEEICNCLNNEQCNIINGSCPSGCQENYEGHMCQKIKGSAVKTSETNQENATYGAIGGVVAVVVMVVVVVVVFIWRRKARSVTKKNGTWS
ncbi:multiple epidermal growth factor-like domains protein 10, partial [Saccostrea cucullata]|uniref:multiple epidermal growth factor-like domains protein 10 n=1 Tax=Saccostrea cuccullata TaxID=36930 RepID=UPI002ED664D3